MIEPVSGDLVQPAWAHESSVRAVWVATSETPEWIATRTDALLKALGAACGVSAWATDKGDRWEGAPETLADIGWNGQPDRGRADRDGIGWGDVDLGARHLARRAGGGCDGGDAGYDQSRRSAALSDDGGDTSVGALLLVESGLAFDGVCGPKRLASGVNALDGLNVSLLCERGMLLEQTSPGVDRVRALQENHPTVRREIEQAIEHRSAGLEFSGVRSSVDVPGVGVPGKDLPRRNAMLLKEFKLALGGWIVVFDGEEPRAGIFLGFRSWVAQHGDDKRVDASVHRGDLGQPKARLGVLEVSDKLVDRRDVRIHAGVSLLLLLKSWVLHSSCHEGSISSRTDMAWNKDQEASDRRAVEINSPCQAIRNCGYSGFLFFKGYYRVDSYIQPIGSVRWPSAFFAN